MFKNVFAYNAMLKKSMRKQARPFKLDRHVAKCTCIHLNVYTHLRIMYTHAPKQYPSSSDQDFYSHRHTDVNACHHI